MGGGEEGGNVAGAEDEEGFICLCMAWTAPGCLHGRLVPPLVTATTVAIGGAVRCTQCGGGHWATALTTTIRGDVCLSLDTLVAIVKVATVNAVTGMSPIAVHVTVPRPVTTATTHVGFSIWGDSTSRRVRLGGRHRRR